jgi:predicted esterase
MNTEPGFCSNLKWNDMKIAMMVAGLVFAVSAVAWSESIDWSPEKKKEAVFTERKLETFEHGVKQEWGYPAPQRDTFLVLHPKQARSKAPLYVVLHSAGHDVHSCLACTTQVGNHDIYHAPEDFFALYLDCRANKGDWWWGDDKYKGPEVSPTDKRVIDTVKWVIKQYDIDENRVYLSGNSMGGSGTLGIGTRHGDVFAAIKANVPAKVEHVSHRMYFSPLTVPADVMLPDPPIVVDYSAPNDSWSKGHEAFAKAMNDRKYALYLYWGPFGHANNHAEILKVNDLINSFDWLNVKKNEAYAVFTNASTNDALPWPDQLADKKAGQVNAFFRWKNISDTANSAEIAVFLVKPSELKTSFKIPSEATADVSLRRLQKLKVAPGETITWTFGTDNGDVNVDVSGIITIPRLRITSDPAIIKIQKVKNVKAV